MKMSKEADYGNWVPTALMSMLWGVTSVLIVVTIALFTTLATAIPGIILLIVTIAALSMTLYMQICRNMFDFNGGGVMGDVHQFLINHFPWDESRKSAGVTDGSGLILDIGCGSAALTNRVAKAYPNVKMISMDYWGAEWNYAKEQCEKNAKIEGVADRITFKKGDAAKLDYDDASFDGAVSNFVFHEVRSAKDKRDVVKEALRVIKPGGAFAFQDMFGQKSVYGDMNEFIKGLKESGVVKEINYIENIERKIPIPAFVSAPWMIKDAGLIYGIKG